MGRNQEGFTLIEVLITMVILSVGIFGLMKAADSTLFFQTHSKNVTEATLNTTNNIEEVKQISANDPAGGAYGFNYLVTDYLTDEGFTKVDDWTYSKSETADNFTTTITLQVYPAGGQEKFDDPTSIHMLELEVKTAWTDSRGGARDVEMATIIHRRQFIE